MYPISIKKNRSILIIKALLVFLLCSTMVVFPQEHFKHPSGVSTLSSPLYSCTIAILYHVRAGSWAWVLCISWEFCWSPS